MSTVWKVLFEKLPKGFHGWFCFLIIYLTLLLLGFLEMVSFIIRFVMSLVYKGICSSSSSVRSSTAAQKEQRQGFFCFFRISWICVKMLLSHVPAGARIWIAVQVQKANLWTGNTSGKINFVPEQPAPRFQVPSDTMQMRTGNQFTQSAFLQPVVTLSAQLLPCKHLLSFSWTHSLKILCVCV